VAARDRRREVLPHRQDARAERRLAWLTHPVIGGNDSAAISSASGTPESPVQTERHRRGCQADDGIGLSCSREPNRKPKPSRSRIVKSRKPYSRSAIGASTGAPLACARARTHQRRRPSPVHSPAEGWAAQRVALSLATFLESGDRRRLKLCANPGCGFAFVDTSTNATRRWCDMRYCGNRLKARVPQSESPIGCAPP
jgi:hypothetical protein